MRVRTYVDWENDRQFHGHVSLPDPDLCVPLNDPPSEGWALLPWGSAIQVTKESDHLDVLLDFVPPTGNGQILVTLHLFGAGARTKYDGVEVRLGGERIGELTKASSQKFAAAVRHFDGLGLTTVARAHIKGSSLSAEVTLKAAKAHELTESDLDPEISPLPRLVPYSADADDYDVPPAYRDRSPAGHVDPVAETPSHDAAVSGRPSPNPDADMFSNPFATPNAVHAPYDDPFGVVPAPLAPRTPSTPIAPPHAHAQPHAARGGRTKRAVLAGLVGLAGALVIGLIVGAAVIGISGEDDAVVPVVSGLWMLSWIAVPAWTVKRSLEKSDQKALEERP